MPVEVAALFCGEFNKNELLNLKASERQLFQNLCTCTGAKPQAYKSICKKNMLWTKNNHVSKGGFC